MPIGAVELLFLLVFFAVPLWGIFDAVVRPGYQWQAVDRSRALWIVIQLIFGILGAIAYFAFVRPKLTRVTTR